MIPQRQTPFPLKQIIRAMLCYAIVSMGIALLIRNRGFSVPASLALTLLPGAAIYVALWIADHRRRNPKQ
jgi:hypothetical protein